MLQRVFAVDAPDMLVAARSVVGSSRRGTSATSPADLASSAITTTVTGSAASSPRTYRSASRPIPSTRRTRLAPIRTVIPLRPGTTPRTVTGATATSSAVAICRREQHRKTPGPRFGSLATTRSQSRPARPTGTRSIRCEGDCGGECQIKWRLSQLHVCLLTDPRATEGGSSARQAKRNRPALE